MAPLERYDALTSAGNTIRVDPHQRAIVQKLDDLWHELQHYTAPIPVTNTPPPPDKHIYDDLEEYESVFTSVSKRILVVYSIVMLMRNGLGNQVVQEQEACCSVKTPATCQCTQVNLCVW